MSTAPPPPPFGSDPRPYADPTRYDRRAWKAQRRATAAEARRQASAFRAQQRAAARLHRRPSIAGPVLLLSLGVVLLLIQTGKLQWGDTLEWFARWWPAILIVAGLILAGEWAAETRRRREGDLSPASHRSLSSGGIFLLVLLGLVGVSAQGFQTHAGWIEQDLDESLRQNGFENWREHFGLRTDSTEELHAPLPTGGRLIIESPRGDVSVTGASLDGQVHVTVHRHVFAWSKNDADDRHRAQQVHLSGNGAELTLTAAATGEDDADLTIEMPHNAALTVRSVHGDVTLEEVGGAIDVRADDGDVKLTALRGPVHLATADDNADITAHSLAGGLTLEGRSGDTDLSDIDGPVILHGDFFGATHMERIRGSVHFQSSFTDFACAGVPGSFEVEGRSDLEADHLLGPVTLATTNRNLTLHHVSGATTIHDRNGSITLGLSGPPELVHILNENGSVDLSVPAQGSFSLLARTDNGRIENDFGGVAQKNGALSQLRDQIGHGGPVLSLQTTEGDIAVHKATTVDEAGSGDSTEVVTPVPDTSRSSRFQGTRSKTRDPQRSL